MKRPFLYTHFTDTNICILMIVAFIMIALLDTYMKVYLSDKGRQMHKRKTRVVQSDCNPQYRQTLKYDAAMIYGRTLLVSVWEKQKGFEHNSPIGAVEIQVNQLELHKLTIGWYKLENFDDVKHYSD